MRNKPVNAIKMRASMMTLFLLAFFTILTPTRAAAVDFAKINGDTLKFEENQDVLALRVIGKAAPKLTRYGNTNRIVVEFHNAVITANLVSLLAGKRGTCVERFETHVFSRYAEAGPTGGILHELTAYDSVLIAYVESGVEADIDTAGDMIAIRYYRVDPKNKQTRPIPENKLSNRKIKLGKIHLHLMRQIAKIIAN